MVTNLLQLWGRWAAAMSRACYALPAYRTFGYHFASMRSGKPLPSRPWPSKDAKSSGGSNATLWFPTSWFKSLTAYVLAVGSALVGVERLPRLTGLPLTICAPILIVPIVLAFLFGTLPKIRENRRIKRLEQIRGAGKVGYFQLAPRQDEASFQRADGMHEKILEWLRRPPRCLLYLTGASGAGKSSLLTAWVIPRLEREGTRVMRLRGYQDPASLLETLLRTLIGADRGSPSEAAGLNVLLEEAQMRVHPLRLLVIFDQFEEFLISKQGPERERFRAFINEHARGDEPGPAILLVFRDEYDLFIQKLGLPSPVYEENFQKVPVFTEAAARDFLTGSGLNFDEKLQSSVLNEAAEAEGTLGLIRPITINLCGLVLSRFVTGLPSKFRPGQMIRGFVQESILQPQIADVTPILLPKLISERSTKLPRTIGELVEGTDLTPEQAQGAMFRLSDPERSIVRPLDREQDVWEISHDFLVPVIGQILAGLGTRLWKGLRTWLPMAAAVVVLALSFVWPRMLPDPVSDLTQRGWNVQSHWDKRGSGRVLVYDIVCTSCTTGEIEAGARDLRRLQGELNVTFMDVAAFDSRHLGSWAGLRVKSLTLFRSPNLADISEVGRLGGLEALNLPFDGAIQDAQLSGLPSSLLSLTLLGTRVSDAAVKGLPRGLTTLELASNFIGPPSRLTNACIKDLPQKLRILQLDGAGITDTGLSGLPKSLRELGLGRTKITDAGIPDLPQGIVLLDLYGTSITDAGLRHLPKSLQQIDLTNTNVSKTGIKRLPPGVQSVQFRPAPPKLAAYAQ